jgi:hypothetical protein
MGKVIKKGDRPEFFAQGGSSKMLERGTAHPVVPGQSGKEANGGSDAKFAAGGKTKMFGKGHANRAEAGQSAKNSQ